MATLIPRRNLSRNDEESIVKLLTIQPIEQSSYFNKQAYQQGKESFPFFQVDRDVVRVPYAFGSVFLKTHPHETKPYHPIKVAFTSSLRPRQKKKIAKLDPLFKQHHTVTFCAHTGFGKTRIANYYIARFKLLTVVLVPGTQLMEQWPLAIKELLPMLKVGIVGEDYHEDFIDPENPFGEGEEQHPDVLVCMPDRWAKIPAEVRSKVGFLIVDEAHMFCTPTRCISLLQFEPKYIMALTASPRRRDDTMGVIKSLCGLHQVKARYKNPVTVWHFQTGLVFETSKDMRGKTNWTMTLKRIVSDEERNQMLADLAAYLVYNLSRKPLLMSERKYHIEDLDARLKAMGISADYLMANKNSYRDSQVVLAIMKKAGTGFDEQYACPDFGGKRIDTVVYCSSFKEINGLIQYGGRAFRADDPLIIHCVDKNGIVEKHWRDAQKYYRSGEYLANVNIQKITPETIWILDEEVISH